ncbi:MAG TPA: sensor histidine kinase [Rhizomicrobium sp.]|jgi:two-component sensor histidine kinase|nr:sensor histidine kinase [Rhizomicrobium sp.]
MVSIGSAFQSARATVLNAIIGRRTGDAHQSEEGLSFAARGALTLLIFAATTIIWWTARSYGVLGTAALYFPATLLVTLLAGWEFGLVIMVAGAVLVWRVAHSQFAGATLVVFAMAGVLQLLIAGFVRELLRNAWQAERELQSLAERRAREAEAREMVLGEARHRLKNLMAIIEALAKFSGAAPGQDPAVEAYVKRFLGRLRALGTASDLVLRHGFDVLEATAVVRAVLEPFLSVSPPRLIFDGPPVVLSERFGGALALAVHELASNALKYGSLSEPGGTVDFRWTVTAIGSGEHVEFVWAEYGGPTPVPPPRDGFGHRLIRSVVSGEAEGKVQIEYPLDGLVCRIAYLHRHPAVRN